MDISPVDKRALLALCVFHAKIKQTGKIFLNKNYTQYNLVV